MHRSSATCVKQMLVRNRSREKFNFKVLLTLLFVWLLVQSIQLHARGIWMTTIENRLEFLERKTK